jgi:hypothetical protein
MRDPSERDHQIRNEAMRELRRAYVEELYRRMRLPENAAYRQGIAIVATWIDRGEL